MEGDELVYEHSHEGYKPYSVERVRPRVEQWASFERWLQVVDPWAWNGEYRLPPEQTVTDGTHWSLQLTWAGGHVEASGDNAYPPYAEGPDWSPQWEVFCAAVERLLSGLHSE